MSEFVEEDWKLKAHAIVKLRRENTNMLVSLSYVYNTLSAQIKQIVQFVLLIISYVGTNELG